eukprot:TRINITY_DN6278_c0_g1_i2.p1 TRINITY_DN6278_c0_g1~~TRINITY_DN6278_c0_g1_i2.p1  ORF type:complete len:396 (+),score=106.88 TRINITY_DN6278_c0_g1_i2:41-1189(+)
MVVLSITFPSVWFTSKSSYFLKVTTTNKWTSSQPNVSTSPISNLQLSPPSPQSDEIITPTEQCPLRTEVAYQTTKASFRDTAFRFNLSISQELDDLINEELRATDGGKSSQTSTAISSRPVFQIDIELLEIPTAGGSEKAVLVGVTQYRFTVGLLAKLLKNESGQAKLVVVSSPSSSSSSSSSVLSGESSAEVAVVARIDAAFLLTYTSDDNNERRESFASPRTVFPASKSQGNVTILVHRASHLPTQLEDGMPPTAFVTATLPSTPGKGSSTKQVVAETNPVFNHMMFLDLSSTEMKSGVMLSLVNNNNKGLISSCLIPVDGFLREQQVNLCLCLTSEDARSRNLDPDIELYVSVTVHESAENVYKMYETAERDMVYTQVS